MDLNYQTCHKPFVQYVSHDLKQGWITGSVLTLDYSASLRVLANPYYLLSE